MGPAGVAPDCSIVCRFIGLLTLAPFFVSFSIAQSKVDTVSIQTSSHCSFCERDIEKFLRAQKGIKKVEFIPGTGRVKFWYSPTRIHPDSVRTGLSSIGYDVDGVKAKNRMEKLKHTQCTEK